MGLGVITVLMTLVGWSAVPLFIKHFSYDIDLWTSNGWRYGFSALLWAPVLIFGAFKKNLPKGLWKAAFWPSFFNSTGQTLFAYAFYILQPGLATFSLRIQIIFVAVGAAMLFPSERRIIRSTGFIIGVCLVMIGTLTLIALNQGSLQGASTLGLLVPISAGLLFACYGLSVRRCMHGIPPLVAFSAISQYTAAAMLTLMLVFGQHAGATALDLSSSQFALLLLSSFIGIALGHVCYYTAIARLGVAVSSGVIQLQPVFVSIASYFLFDEYLSPYQWCAGAIALSGAATILVIQHRMKKSERPASMPTSPNLVDTEFAELPLDHVAAAASDSSTSLGRG